MPWESRTVEDLRKEFVLAERECDNFSSLCREFGITRRTGYKWKERYQNGESLSDLSRKPATTANKTPVDTELLIVSLRIENPGWGAKKT